MAKYHIFLLVLLCLTLTACPFFDSESKCGDEVIQGNEECDGNNFGVLTCNTIGFPSGSLACTNSCRLDTSGCQNLPGCGNGITEGEEACDGQDLNGASCQDVGIGDGQVSCTNSCTVDYSECTAIHQWGTSGIDRGTNIAIDSMGNVFVVGFTDGNLLGNVGRGEGDVFLMKFSWNGELLWTQTYGTQSNEYAFGLAIDPDDNIIFSGMTAGNLGGQTSRGGEDGFVMKTDNNGEPIWTRLIGTSGTDAVSWLTVDPMGNVHVTGRTTSAFPSFTNRGGTDVFYAKLSPTGETLFISQWGDSGDDAPGAIRVDSEGSILIMGRYTPSGTANGLDCRLTKLGSQGAELWTTTFGTSGNENCYDFSLDHDGTISFAGSTAGVYPGESSSGNFDAVFAKLDGSGEILWLDQVGSTDNDHSTGTAISTSGDYFFSGCLSGSLDGQTAAGSADIYLVGYNSEGQRIWSKMWGSSSWDNSGKFVFDSYGNAWITGYAEAAFPGKTHYGNMDIVLIHTHVGY
ncbi:SBBP repeat-containing protein [Myxococcota bacterium]|nr:SBBP repeat-containing protein [Myxococcota bacterium]MBU1535033.1 SBBP repeat-containing protein [Myxococcota bacterium]